MANFAKLGVTPNQFPDPFKTPQYSGSLLIVGGGRCVWDDLARIDYSIEWDVMCVNDIIMHYPGDVHHAYSNDNRTLPKWVAARRPRYAIENKLPIQHSCNTLETGYKWPFPGHGTSGLGAVYVGLAIGYTNIVLCGIPMDGTGHYFDPPTRTTNYASGMRYWRNAVPIFNGAVSSQSGLTRELLGQPNFGTTDNHSNCAAFG